MKRKNKSFWGIAAIIALPVIGYVLAHGSVYVIPMEDQTTLYHGLFTIALIVILLVVPYLMIKLLGHIAHLQNSNEKEINLTDIPKDKDQLRRSMNR